MHEIQGVIEDAFENADHTWTLCVLADDGSRHHVVITNAEMSRLAGEEPDPAVLN